MSETVRVAFAGLTANKLRSGLTMLGLMIGVGSVIVLIAVGTGSSNAVEKQIDALGTNVLLVTTGPTLGGLRRAAASATALTVSRRAARCENRFQAPDVKSVSPVVNANGVTLTSRRDDLLAVGVVGTTPSYPQARSYTLASGTWFTPRRRQATAACWCIGPTVARTCSPAGSGRADGAGQRHELSGRRRHRPEGLERDRRTRTTW